MNSKDKAFLDIFKKCIEHANKKYDGHFTLMKFTTNWRFCFGTILEPLPSTEFMAEGKTPEEAMRKGLEGDINSYEIDRLADEFRSRPKYKRKP